MPDPGTPAAPAAPSPPPQDGRLARLPFHWLLFAAYPVLFLYSQNIGELEPGELLIPLAVTMGLAAAGFLVLSRFLDPRRAAIIVSGLVILLAMFGPISENIHAFAPQLWLRLLLLVAAAAVVVAIALRLKGGLGTATLALDVLGLVLVLFAAVPIVQQVVGELTAPASDAPSGVKVTATGPGTSRDIWWVILDRYGSDASLRALFGITDNDFGPWLESKGFVTLDESHANYVRTSLSIASALHMTQLDELAARMGADSEKYGPVYDMLKDHPVGRFLKEQGYTFTQVGSWFPPTRESDIADAMLRPGASRDFGTLVYDASIVQTLQRMLPDAAESDRSVDAARYQWAHLGELCRKVDHQFVFAHILLPHPPYVFHADGTPVKPGTQSSYAEQLQYTNDQMRKLVECLQDRPADQQPIIILQADEGPYPPRYGADQIDFDWSGATPEELIAKYGILNAMSLPGLPEGVEPPQVDLSSVNTFRYLLSSYFGADLPPLPDTSWTSPKLTPYDLTEITGRIPAADASFAPMPRPAGVAEGEIVPEGTFEP